MQYGTANAISRAIEVQKNENGGIYLERNIHSITACAGLPRHLQLTPLSCKVFLDAITCLICHQRLSV